MTARKRDLFLPVRTPAYVSREVGAAELCISPETWDVWVSAGKLPRACPLGISGTTPRWRWADVDAYLSGKPMPAQTPDDAKPASAEPYFREVVRGTAKKRKHVSPKRCAPHRQTERENVLLLPAREGHAS